MIFFKQLDISGTRGEIAANIIKEIYGRLLFLSNVGLNYLSLERSAETLSGGESQRVAVARTLITDPGAFLLDEPLSSLDAKLRREMRAEVDRLHKELKKTFIYVTHDQEEAMTLADRIVVMDGGNIRQVGSPIDIYNNSK